MRSLVKILAILGLFCAFLEAEILNYDELKDKPKSLAKDYYIYRLIDEQKPQKAQISALRSEVYRYKGKLAKKLDQILGVRKFKSPCSSYSIKNIMDANATCQKAVLSPNAIKKLDEKTYQKLLEKLANNATLLNLLQGMKTQNPAVFFAKTQNAENFFRYFNSLSENEQNAKFNFEISAQFADLITQRWEFKSLIENIVIKDKFEILAQSLINANAEILGDETAFFLGLNALKFQNETKALQFFKATAYNSKKITISQNAKFWLYLISGDKKALNELANSDYYDIYALLAKEKLGKKNLNIIIPNPNREIAQNYDITDPFAWVKTKNKVDNAEKNGDFATLKKMAEFFDTKSTIGEYSYITNKLNGKKDNFYAMPFLEHIGTNDNHRKAIILALARQESRFIPSAISISYALGMMQFMPFVANDIAKKQGIARFDQDNMFRPEVAYRFANIHLDYLEKYLQSPVFIAYAYNGGIGFTKRMLQNGLFSKNGKYEPYLAMELVPYAESRDYAKKVLANFVIYSQILGVNVSPEAEILKLSDPKRSDFIR